LSLLGFNFHTKNYSESSASHSTIIYKWFRENFNTLLDGRVFRHLKGSFKKLNFLNGNNPR